MSEVVPAQPGIQGQTLCDLPIVLDISAHVNGIEFAVQVNRRISARDIDRRAGLREWEVLREIEEVRELERRPRQIRLDGVTLLPVDIDPELHLMASVNPVQPVMHDVVIVLPPIVARLIESG